MSKVKISEKELKTIQKAIKEMSNRRTIINLDDLDEMPNDYVEPNQNIGLPMVDEIEKELDDDEDEEIFSDTDQENLANELKKAKKQKKVTNFKSNQLNEDQLEDYLSKMNKSFQKYR